MIRRILVPLDISAFAESATARACEIAKAHGGATVTGMAVVDTLDISLQNAPVYAALIPKSKAQTAKMTKDAAGQLEAALKGFRKTCETQGVAHEEVFLHGAPAARILEASLYHDLTVVGQRTFFHFETQKESDGQSLKDILAETPAPVLAVPGPAHARPFETVLIAFDGSHNSVRALREFALFAAPYDFEVIVVTSGDTQEQAHLHADHARTFLVAHGITNVKIDVTEENIIKKVERDYLPWADLIVAGVHTRHSLGDLFVGSLANFLIERGQTPILLGQ